MSEYYVMSHLSCYLMFTDGNVENISEEFYHAETEVESETRKLNN